MTDHHYFKRQIDDYLLQWKAAPTRKPLLLRGARQVGKSSAVRELAKKFDYFVEVNFEKNSAEYDVKSIFERHHTPMPIVEELGVMLNTPLLAGRTLLFLDEIQECPAALLSLRYFYEEFPELHVIAAGSLLEFALAEMPTFGVGRIRSIFLYPFSFAEYLRAAKLADLAEHVAAASPEHPLSAPLHQQCRQQLVRFIALGGMPEVLATYLRGGSLLDCQQVLDDLWLALQTDFAKYKERVPALRLRETLLAIVEQTGGKFVYSKVASNANHGQLKDCVELLTMAGLAHPVTHSAGDGLPLAARQKRAFRKYLLFDTGIFQRCLQVDLATLLRGETLEQINKGAIAELFAGLEMLKAAPPSAPRELFYWHREQRGSNAEVDYLAQIGGEIIPLEIKSGVRGAMQSMALFLAEKKSPYGIRCSLENFGALPQIRIYPLYAIANIFQNTTRKENVQ